MYRTFVYFFLFFLFFSLIEMESVDVRKKNVVSFSCLKELREGLKTRLLLVNGAFTGINELDHYQCSL